MKTNIFFILVLCLITFQSAFAKINCSSTCNYSSQYWSNVELKNDLKKHNKTSTDTYHCSNIESSFESFFRYEGVKLLAKLAHPTNSFVSGKFTDKGSYFIVIFTGEDNWFGGTVKTKLKIRKTGRFLSGLEVIYDTDIVEPFVAMDLLHEFAQDMIKDSNTRDEVETMSFMEKKLRKEFNQFNGRDIALTCLNLSWFNY